MKRCSIWVLVLILSALVCACTGSSVATIFEDGDTEASADGDADTNEATQDGDTDTADGDQAEAETEPDATQDGDTDTESEAASEQEPEAEQLVDGDTEADSEADSEAACDTNSCAIGGTCYAKGALDPASPCRKCDLATSRTAWTNLAFAAACNDGNACTKNDACDGQGACKGTPDAACQADGDAEYDPDIDPEEVKIGEKCPEQGLAICFHQVVLGCPAGLAWGIVANCADSDTICWRGECVSSNSIPDYQGCTQGDSRCVGSVVQGCSSSRQWGIVADCSSDGNRCWLGECVSK